MADVDPMQFLRVDPGQAMKEQSKTFDAKKWVWVPVQTKEGYAAAQVQSIEGETVTVELENGKVVSCFTLKSCFKVFIAIV